MPYARLSEHAPPCKDLRRLAVSLCLPTRINIKTKYHLNNRVIELPDHMSVPTEDQAPPEEHELQFGIHVRSIMD
jgi:hypothetical protein